MPPTGDPESLNDLGRRSRLGDEDAFLALYDNLARSMLGTALRMLGTREEAEDAVQEAFLSLVQQRSRQAPASDAGVASAQPEPPWMPDNVTAWLRRVTANACLDRLRRRRRWREDELDEAASARAAAGAAAPRREPPTGLRLDLERAVARLPERARLVFLLHDVEGLKHEEVGALLVITAGTSKAQLFRAREMLRGWLGGRAGDPDRPERLR